MQSEVAALEKARLEELARRPNTTVYTVEHEGEHDPWNSDRVSTVLERIVAKTQAFASTLSDFAVRKECLKDPEILEFQRKHPQLYWIVTDREKMAEPKYRNAVSALLEVRRRVESGAVAEGRDADAAATRTVMEALK